MAVWFEGRRVWARLFHRWTETGLHRQGSRVRTEKVCLHIDIHSTIRFITVFYYIYNHSFMIERKRILLTFTSELFYLCKRILALRILALILSFWLYVVILYLHIYFAPSLIIWTVFMHLLFSNTYAISVFITFCPYSLLTNTYVSCSFWRLLELRWLCFWNALNLLLVFLPTPWMNLNCIEFLICQQSH